MDVVGLDPVLAKRLSLISLGHMREKLSRKVRLYDFLPTFYPLFSMILMFNGKKMEGLEA